jgi:hypothetical protein
VVPIALGESVWSVASAVRSLLTLPGSDLAAGEATIEDLTCRCA